MKKILLFATLLLAGGKSFSQANIPGLQHPESVTFDGEFYYVSNIGLEANPLAEDGDGFITKISLDGLIQDRLYIPRRGKLNAPKGMAIIGKILFVTDINKVYGFALNKRQRKVFEIEIDESKFLNALVAINQNELLVTATDVDAIFRIDILQKEYRKLNIDGSVNGPNGMAFDSENNTLYVVGYGTNNQANGKIGKMTLNQTPQLEILSDYHGHMDGLFIYENTLMFTDWGDGSAKSGTVKRLNMSTGEVSTVLDKLGGPADMYYSYDREELWIPIMMENRVFQMKY